MQSVEKSKEVDEADVGNALGSSEIVAIHQVKQLPSHTTGLTHPNEEKAFAIVPANVQDDDIDKESKGGNNDIPSGPIATGSNFHSLNKDDTGVNFKIVIFFMDHFLASIFFYYFLSTYCTATHINECFLIVYSMKCMQLQQIFPTPKKLQLKLKKAYKRKISVQLIQ